MGSLHIGTYFSRENFDKMVAFCTKLALNWQFVLYELQHFTSFVYIPLVTTKNFDLWPSIKNMAFIPKFHCGIGTFTLSKIRNTRKNSGRKIKK